MNPALQTAAYVAAAVLSLFIIREAVHYTFDFGIAHYTCPDCGAPNNTSEADALWWTCYRCHKNHLPYVGRETSGSDADGN